MPTAEPESKQKRFERLAERRVNAAIRVLRLIGNLSDRRNYEYTDVHAQQLVAVLDQEVRALKARFRTDGNDSSKQFKFKAKK